MVAIDIAINMRRAKMKNESNVMVGGLHPTTIGRIKRELEVLKSIVSEDTYMVILAAKAASKGISAAELQWAMDALAARTKAGVSEERAELVDKVFNLAEEFLSAAKINEDLSEALRKIEEQVPTWKRTYAVKGEMRCPGFRIVFEVTEEGINVTDVTRIPVPRTEK